MIVETSIKKPIFVTCIFLLFIVLGLFSLVKIPVNLFPDIEFPFVTVITPYPGAGPKDTETISKLLEDNLNNLEGLKKIYSVSENNFSRVTLQFNLSMNIKIAEQEVRQKVFNIIRRLPKNATNPVIYAINPADQPILYLSLKAKVEDKTILNDLAKDIIPYFERLEGVGEVGVYSNYTKEYLISLDEKKLKKRNITALTIYQKLQNLGMNYPLGDITLNNITKKIRAVGEINNINDIKNFLISFFGNEKAFYIKDISHVHEYIKKSKRLSLLNKEEANFLAIKKRPGANTLEVVNQVEKNIKVINEKFKDRYKDFSLSITRNASKGIKLNVEDVYETIIIGIFLTIFVVYFFLRNIKSTFITALALPNSLLGSFILMYAFGFSINVTTLLALSLAVGLLIDDAIIVRESIFHYMEKGFSPLEASLKGTKEVLLAVFATTIVIIAVFAPVAFLQGIVGQFFKEFGLTICFAMIISFIDAITMAPMLSTYLGTSKIKTQEKPRKLTVLLEKLTDLNLKKPYISILLSLFVFVFSLFPAGFIFKDTFPKMKRIAKTFLPTQDIGEFSLVFEIEKGSSLEQTRDFYYKIHDILSTYPEFDQTIGSIGSEAFPHKGNAFVLLKNKRSRKTQEIKDLLRKDFSNFREKIYILDLSGVTGGSESPFNLFFIGNDLNEVKDYTLKVEEEIKNKLSQDLEDIRHNYEEGSPELVLELKEKEAAYLGVNIHSLGQELQLHEEGLIVGALQEGNYNYDIRLRTKEETSNPILYFDKKFIANVNFRPVPLVSVAKIKEEASLTAINRFNKQRYLAINANINPKGEGLTAAVEKVTKILKDMNLPKSLSYEFIGQAEDLADLQKSVMLATLLSIILIFLIISSLYDSFLVSFVILLIIPLAICGAFFGLYFTSESLNLFSMIGCIFLIGMAAKNSILLVDAAHERQSLELKTAIKEAVLRRVRPIMMTSLTLVAGMIPIAIGLNEASKQRTSLGIAIIGGIITSTLLSLFVIPSSYYYIEKFRRWTLLRVDKIFN